MFSDLKVAFFVGSSKKDLIKFPLEVRREIGHAIQVVQRGNKPASAKPLKGFIGAGVLEIIDNHDGDTYRAIYTVRFSNAVYVLHCFQKKSKKGIATPKQEIEKIKSRLKEAELHYKQKILPGIINE